MLLNERLKDKIALVTGGSRGIGAAVVERLAAEGAKVYFTYNASEADARKLCDSIGRPGRVEALKCDVKNADEVAAVVDGVIEKEDRLDVLVNGAGVIRDGLFLTMSDDDWREVLDTNLGGVYNFCKAAAQQMMFQGGGRIVNISSISGELGAFGQANYAASKGAVNAFTKSLAS